jgi:hypothetical protein
MNLINYCQTLPYFRVTPNLKNVYTKINAIHTPGFLNDYTKSMIFMQLFISMITLNQ